MAITPGEKGGHSLLFFISVSLGEALIMVAYSIPVLNLERTKLDILHLF